MTTRTMPAATQSPAAHWCGPLEIEHALEARRSADLPLGPMLARLAEATAAADALRRDGSPGPGMAGACFVADPFQLRTLRALPAGRPLRVRARVIGVSDDLTVVACRVSSEGLSSVEATVVARRQTAAAGGALRHTVPPPVQSLGGWSASATAHLPLRRTA